MIDRETLAAGLNGHKPKGPRPETAEERADWTPHGPSEEPTEESRPLPRIWDICELAAAHPKLRDPIIDGWLRAGEILNLIAKTKRGKSFTTYGIVISVATGSSWLGRFACAKRKVLVIDNELHHEDLAHRIPAVAKEMGVRLEDLKGWIKIAPLRGDLRGVHELGRFLESLPAGEYGLIVIDAFYRILPGGMSENDNAAMAQVYNLIDGWAATTGAAIILVSHTSKGDQSEKDITDVGSGAGSQSRACDTHMILRPHEEADCVVLDGALRSWPPVEPIVLRWAFPIWTPADGLDPERLKGNKSEKQASQDADADDVILEICQTWRTRREIKQATGFGETRRDRAIKRLTDKGWLECGTEDRRNNPGSEVFRKTIFAPDKTRTTKPAGVRHGSRGVSTGHDEARTRLKGGAWRVSSATDSVDGTGDRQSGFDPDGEFR